MIRKAERKDLDRVYEMICSLENTVLPEESFSAIYMKLLKREDALILLYENAGEAIGVMEMRTTEQLHHAAKVAEIMSLYVKEGYRDHGIGAMLFREACRYAENAGCVHLELNSSLWRRDAHRFYEREGMQKDHFNFTMKLGKAD